MAFIAIGAYAKSLEAAAKDRPGQVLAAIQRSALSPSKACRLHDLVEERKQTVTPTDTTKGDVQ